MEQLSGLITQKLEAMAGIPGTNPTLRSKRKAINAVFPYAVHLARGGERGMMDVIIRLALGPGSDEFMWRRIGPYIITLFDESSPPCLNQVITLAAPYAGWIYGSYTQNAVSRWAAAVLATPYSEGVGRRVVDTLLQIARFPSLRPHVPVDVWAWLKRRPSLPPVCRGRHLAATPDIFHHVRGLGDTEILTSYFLLVWSEWDYVFFHPDELDSIERDFGGIGMWSHREGLIGHLDHVLEQLRRGLEHFQQHRPEFDEDYLQRREEQYGQLRKILLKADRAAMTTLSRTLFESTLYASVNENF